MVSTRTRQDHALVTFTPVADGLLSVADGAVHLGYVELIGFGWVAYDRDCLRTGGRFTSRSRAAAQLAAQGASQPDIPAPREPGIPRQNASVRAAVAPQARRARQV